MFNVKFLRNFPLGVLVGALIGIIACVLLDADISEGVKKFYTYLLSAVVTLSAAGLALSGVLANLKHQEDLRQQERTRSHRASIAVLPLTLDQMLTATDKAFETTLQLKSLRLLRPSERQLKFDQLRLSKNEVEQIRDCIMHADEASQEWLTLVLSYWQVASSSLGELLLSEDQIVTSGIIGWQVAQWIYIRAMLGHLFDYSRSGVVPANELDENLISVTLRHRSMMDDLLQKKVEKEIDYGRRNGGWTLEGFKSRIVD